MAKFERNLAVVIGIDRYTHGISPLSTAANDARMLAKILQQEHQYYPIWQFLDPIQTASNQPDAPILPNQSATRTNLEELLTQTLPTEVTPDDRLLFYFAGHGIALNGEDGPQGYLIPQDAKLGDVSTYLPMTQVEAALAQLPCRHCLIILDCCFAGAFRWSSTRKLTPITEVIHKERFERFIQDPAWQVITSASHDQYALDALDLRDDRGIDPLKPRHSPFAAALIDALSGNADAYPPAKDGKPAGDGVITATELYIYLRDCVEVATDAHHTRQTPGLWCLKKHDKGEYIFLSPGHGLNLPDAPKLDTEEEHNPYRGLKAYEKEHSHLFFGRTTLVEKLCDGVCEQPLTIVLGASGSGKSSLVKAGLIPHLENFDLSQQPYRKLDQETKQHQHKHPQWQILAPIRLGETPLVAFSNALKDTASPLADLLKQAELTSEALVNALISWNCRHPDTYLLIVIDQLEELVTLCKNEQERSDFFNLLATLLHSSSHQLRILLTLRSDFEPQFRDTVLEPYWAKARFMVPAMTREELKEAIEEPAATKVVYFETNEPRGNLVEQLIDEVASMPGALPLLSFSLSELYLKLAHRFLTAQTSGETPDRAITWNDYDELGGVTRSLTQRADQEYEALVNQDPAYAETIHHVMLRMVALGGELARRRVSLSELEYPEPKNTQVKAFIQRFAEARLLTSSTDTENQPYVEPAHDVLVRGWQRLLEWKERDLASLLLQRELTPSVNKWVNDQQNKQSLGLLWDDDPRLPLLRQVFDSDNSWLNRQEAEFVRRSIQRNRNNRFRLIGAITTFVGVVGIAGTVALSLGIDAQNQLLKVLVASSREFFDANNRLDALRESLRAAKQLQHPFWNAVVSDATQQDVTVRLLTAAYGVKERNRLEQAGSITGVAFSPDGEQIVIASENDSINLWQPNGTLIRSLPPEGYAITSLSFSPDGQTIAAGTAETPVILTQPEGTFKLLSGHSRRVTSVAFSPDGQFLVTGSEDSSMKLWRVRDRRLLRNFEGGAVTSLSFSPDGQMIASASGNTIKLWQDGDLVRTLTGHTDEVTSISFSPSGRYLASASADKTLKLWRVDMPSASVPKAQPSNTQTNPQNSDAAQTLQLSESTASEPEDTSIQTFEGHTDRVTSVNFRADGRVLISGSADHTIKLWRLSDGRVTQTLEGHTDAITQVRFSPKDDQIAISGSADRTVRIWQLSNDNLPILLDNHQSLVSQVDFSSDGQRLVSASWDGTINLWKRDGTLLKTFPAQTERITSISLSSNDQLIAAANWGLLPDGTWDNTIKLWKLDGTVLKSFTGHIARINSLSFSRNGQMLASASRDQTVKLWKPDGTLIKTLEGHGAEVMQVVFSPDPQRLASVDVNGKIKLWNVDGSSTEVAPDEQQAGVSSLNFAPDGQLLVVGRLDGAIEILNLAGETVQTFSESHEQTVSSVAFSPNGQMIASASRDQTIKLWWRDGSLIITFPWHQDVVNSVVFSPDGQLIASASHDWTVRIGAVGLTQLFADSCKWGHDYFNLSYPLASPRQNPNPCQTVRP